MQATPRTQPERSVSIIEVGPRDGLQSEPEVLSTAAKIEFITRAIDAGIRRLEVTSFVHPKRVPQMADAEDVIRGLPQRSDVTYIGLVLNRKGFERAQATGIPEIGMAVVASDTYNQRNQGVPTIESVKAWQDIAKAAKAAGIRANVMISSAFGCPFEGEIPIQKILSLVDQVMEGDPVELGIADSIGVAVPDQVTELLGAVMARRAHTLSFSQYAQHRYRQCPGRLAGGCNIPGCQYRRHRWLSLRASCHGEYSHGRSALHAGPFRCAYRCIPGEDHCHQPVVAGPAWPQHAGDASQGRCLSPDYGEVQGGGCRLTAARPRPELNDSGNTSRDGNPHKAITL
jgi:hypothetical protein